MFEEIAGYSPGIFLLRFIGFVITAIVVIIPWELIAHRLELGAKAKRFGDILIGTVVAGVWLGWD
jgi:hypothetical protein